MMNRLPIRLFSIQLLICLFFTALIPSTTQAQTQPIVYQRYDSDITIRPDGTFLVREIQQIRFDGEFHTAFAEIPGELTTDIRNVQLYEGQTQYSRGSDRPNTFSTENSGNAIFVSWEYEPTKPGDVRTFILEYEVVGGLWVYPDQTVLEWRAIPADRSGIEVESSVVTVTLPAAVTAEQLQYTAYGTGFQAVPSGNGVVFTADGAIPDGVQFQIQVGFSSSLVEAERQPWQIQEDSARLAYRFTALDVELIVEPDGALQVDEYHHLVVDAGVLDQGTRRIALNQLDAIEQIQLSEGEQTFRQSSSRCDYCLQISETARGADWARYDTNQRRVVVNDARAGSVQIQWQFPPLVRGEETTLHLRYRVQGAVRRLDDKQEINWAVVFPEHEKPIESASVRIQLPANIAPEQVTITGGTVAWQADGTAQIVAPAALPPNRAWSIQVALPIDATTAPVPQWQQRLEAAALEAQQAETALARLKLGFGVGAILLLVLGLLGVYLLWFLRGRDRPLPAVADYLTEPPSSLPPAIVAYLIDETPSTKGALASIFHLANLGLLWIRFDEPMALKRVVETNLAEGEALQPTDGDTIPVPRHLVTLFNALRPDLPIEEETPLYRVHQRFQSVLPTVYAQMGEETNRFFDEIPQQARHRWLVRGQWLVLISIAVALLLGWRYFADLGWLAILPALAAIAVGIALIVVSRWMPRRTVAGVEEKDRWLAFRNYLLHLKEYGNLEQAQRVLDRYFAYAVALDVEEVVLEQATALGGSLPDWSYTPTWQPRRRAVLRRDPIPTQPSTGSASSTPSPAGGLPPIVQTPSTPRATPSGTRPSLSGTSKQLARSLTDASEGLGSLLSTAVGDLDSTPFATLWEGTQALGRAGGSVASSTLDVLGDVLEESASGGGGSSYSSSGSSRSSWSSSSSRSSSRSSSSSSGRSSSSRRSGGGGRRGFG